MDSLWNFHISRPIGKFSSRELVWSWPFPAASCYNSHGIKLRNRGMQLRMKEIDGLEGNEGRKGRKEGTCIWPPASGISRFVIWMPNWTWMKRLCWIKEFCSISATNLRNDSMKNYTRDFYSLFESYRRSRATPLSKSVSNSLSWGTTNFTCSVTLFDRNSLSIRVLWVYGRLKVTDLCSKVKFDINFFQCKIISAAEEWPYR